MPSPADLLQERAETFAVRVLQLVRRLPRNPPTDGIARQLGRSGPSTSANYRSARRSRSRAEFIARLGVVVDEADESEHWLSMLQTASDLRQVSGNSPGEPHSQIEDSQIIDSQILKFSRAILAASCSASFLLGPLARASVSPATRTSTSNRLS